MKKNSIYLIILIATTICFGQSKNQKKQLDSLFTLLYQQNQFNGEILIADKGKTIFKKGYGIANEDTKKLIDEKTIFELASCSKQFTGVAIVLLKRDGKLDYTDKISKYLPELSFWEDVTISDLLRHTSGIPDFIFDMKDNWDYTKIATNEDVIKHYTAKKDTLQFKPKTMHSYSNTNYVLLATIIERVSGKKYEDYLIEKIFKPLRMNNTFVYNRRKTPKKIDNYAIGYVWPHDSFKKVTSENPEYGSPEVYYLDGIVGAAKVNSTIDDLYKWIESLKNNTLLTQKEFDKMTEITQTISGENIDYGFGFEVRKGKNNFAFGHTGSWDGYATFIYHDMIRDRTIIILENFRMGVTAIDNIFQILDNKPLIIEYEKKITLPESNIMEFTGLYQDETGKEHVISYVEGHLIYNTPTAKWDMRFFPISKNEFFAIRQGGVNGILKFTKLENGDTKLEMLQYGSVTGTGVKKR